MTLPLFFGLAAILVGLLGCGKSEGPTEVIARSSNRNSVSAEAIDELLNVDAFKAAYISANGGRKSLQELESKRIKGRIEIDGKIQPFFILKKKYGKALLSFDYPDRQLTYGVDGDDVWQRLTVNGQEPSYARVEGEAADSFIDTARFYDPLMSLIVDGDGVLRHIEQSEWEGVACLRVDFSNADSDVKVEAYVDPTSMTVMARRERSTIDDRVHEVLCSDYRNVGGVMEPFHLESYIDGNLEHRIIVESLRPNVGTMKELFGLPEQVMLAR